MWNHEIWMLRCPHRPALHLARPGPAPLCMLSIISPPCKGRAEIAPGPWTVRMRKAPYDCILTCHVTQQTGPDVKPPAHLNA